MTTAAELIAMLDLRRLPGEGGWFRNTNLDDYSSAILYLLCDDDVESSRSVLHRLPSKELWHFYAGAPVDFLTLDPLGGRSRSVVLGADLGAGQRPQVVVEAGVFQGARTRGPWSLLGTTMAPPYTDSGYEPADARSLLDRWPGLADQIRSLT